MTTPPVSGPLDARGVLAFLAAVDAEPGISLHSLLVTRQGERVLEAYWGPYESTDQPLVYSVSKTFTGTAMGYALAEGLLSLDDRIVDLLGVSVPVDVAPRTAEQTVHHVLSMSTGHDTDTLEAALARTDGDFAAGYLSVEPQTPVGSRHVYNNGASWLVGELVRRTSGQTLMDFLQPRLFEPLGIAPRWDVDPWGRELGLSGLHATTRELAALAEVYRTGGAGVLPDGWAAVASQRHIVTEGWGDPEWAHGYGYQLWRCREGYRMDGAFGQFAIILDDLSIVVTSAISQGWQRLFDQVWTYLIPAVRTPAANPEADATLAGKLAGLQLRHPKDAGVRGPWQAPGPLVGWPSLAVGSEQMNLPDIADVTLVRDGDGWALRLTADGQVAELSAPSGDWHRTRLHLDGVDVPVAMAVGTLTSGAARVYLCFTDSCHVLRIELGPGGGRYAWETSPLRHTRLSQFVAR